MVTNCRFSMLGALLLALACSNSSNRPEASSGDGSLCSPGAETCSCHDDGTCDQGLTCRSSVCVSSLAGTGGAGGSSTGVGGSGGAATGGGGVTAGSQPTGGVTSTGIGGVSAGPDAGSGGALSLPPRLTWTREFQGIVAYGIWGSGPNDIYAVGGGGILLHSAGNGKWSSQDAKTGANLTGIWGTGPNDIYVSVESNFILHSTGDGKWPHQSYPAGYVFYDIWGSGPTDVYAVAGGAAHSAGDGIWSHPPQEVTGGPPVEGIWGSSASDVYVVTGNTGGRTIYHSRGDGKWAAQISPDIGSLVSIHGTDARHIWVGGVHTVAFSGGDGNWTTQLEDGVGAIGAVWAARVDAVYACDSTGNFFRSDGQGHWSDAEAFDSKSRPTCLSMWGTDPTNIYIGTSNGIYHGVP